MTTWSLYPVWIIDLLGSIGMIIFSLLCFQTSRKIHKRAPETPLANYLIWFSAAILAFSISRSLGHILKHLLFFSGKTHLWATISPVSGSINSITFIVIASVTLYFRRTEIIMNLMAGDRDRISRTGRQLLELNREIEEIVSERTQVQMALRMDHQVRNPAMVIGGLVRKIIKKMPQDQPQRERMVRVLEQVEKLEELIDKFDAIPPRHDKKFAIIDLNDLIRETLDIVTIEAEEKGVTLHFSPTPTALHFQGAKHLIKQAFINIIRYGVDACSGGDAVKLTTNAEGRYLKTIIEYNGPCPAREVFDPTPQTVLQQRQGKRLDMSYVRLVIEEHHGLFRLAEKPGGGNILEVLLPLMLGELAKTERA
ncbi:MAG: HAMP domain-containing sensor histidine kinase [Pseudomonadota bacterium]